MKAGGSTKATRAGRGVRRRPRVSTKARGVRWPLPKAVCHPPPYAVLIGLPLIFRVAPVILGLTFLNELGSWSQGLACGVEGLRRRALTFLSELHLHPTSRNQLRSHSTDVPFMVGS